MATEFAAVRDKVVDVQADKEVKERKDEQVFFLFHLLSPAYSPRLF